MKNSIKKSFEIIYYINFGFPSIDYSLSIVDMYISAGAKNLQLDLPTKNPDPRIENELILQRMGKAFLNGISYDDYLAGIKNISTKTSNLNLELTVYADTIIEIGIEKFIKFCKETKIAKVSVVENINSGLEELLKELRNNHIFNLHPIVFSEQLEKFMMLAQCSEPISLLLEEGVGTKQIATNARVKDIVSYVNSINSKSKIYGTMGVKSIERVKELMECNLDGVYVGSCLFKLWNDPSELTKKITEFESLLKEK